MCNVHPYCSLLADLGEEVRSVPVCGKMGTSRGSLAALALPLAHFLSQACLLPLRILSTCSVASGGG